MVGKVSNNLLINFGHYYLNRDVTAGNSFTEIIDFPYTFNSCLTVLITPRNQSEIVVGVGMTEPYFRLYATNHSGATRNIYGVLWLALGY